MPALTPSRTPGAQVTAQADGWQLAVPPAAAGRYQLAQVDDYSSLARRAFPHRLPLRLELHAQVSAPNLPGTWGFGLWNDPFSLRLGLRRAERRLPVLPNCAWFFHASPQNYLSLRSDLPPHGWLAGVFSSPPLPGLAVILPAALGLPGLLWPPLARWLRRALRGIIHEDAARLPVDPTQEHAYALEADAHGTRFFVDGELAFQTHLAPRGRLGLVLWVDNQFAAFAPDGRLRFGVLPSSQAAWLALRQVHLRAG